MARDTEIVGLYVAHRSALVEYASGITGDRAHAEDPVQEAWQRLDRAAGLRSLDEPLRYLYRIVRNLALHRDELDCVLAAMAELPERTRIAVEMHRIGGCRLREIAAFLDISVPLAHLLVADGVERSGRLRRCAPALPGENSVR